jgi:hypothetical protein
LKFLDTKGNSPISTTNNLLTDILINVWGMIYKAIQKLSDSTYPTSHLTLRELLEVGNVLRSQQNDARGRVEDLRKQLGWFCYDQHVADVFEDKNCISVLEEAGGLLDEAVKEAYTIWSIPHLLDPRYKGRNSTEIFNGLFGTDGDSYLSEAQEDLRELCTAYSDEDPSQQAASDPRTEVDHYLHAAIVVVTENEEFDILNWWRGESRGYPILAKVSRDALAMPTCSKLSSDQITQVRSILCGYSKEEDEEEET